LADIRIAVVGGIDDDASLWDWLSRDRVLGGAIERVTTPRPGTMGSLWEIGVALGAAAPTIAALAQSLTVWHKQRRSDVELDITMPGGGEVKLHGTNVVVDKEMLAKALHEAMGRAGAPDDPPA
jgi:hypothetical protein